MKGVDWGGLYGQLKDENLDPEGLEADVARLMVDDDVTKEGGYLPVSPHLRGKISQHPSLYRLP